MKTEVNLAGIVMKNPVMPASGTFGYGRGGRFRKNYFSEIFNEKFLNIHTYIYKYV